MKVALVSITQVGCILSLKEFDLSGTVDGGTITVSGTIAEDGSFTLNCQGTALLAKIAINCTSEKGTECACPGVVLSRASE